MQHLFRLTLILQKKNVRIGLPINLKQTQSK